MEFDELAGQVLETWRRHNEILLLLLAAIPAKGMTALPAGSRGRTVALQFAHVDHVRRGWLSYFETGKRPKLPRDDKANPPNKPQLKKTLRDSARKVEAFLSDCIQTDAVPKRFSDHALRWMGYLIAHESHHRGQIALALKQSGLRLPEKVSMDGLWGRWFAGK